MAAGEETSTERQNSDVQHATSPDPRHKPEDRIYVLEQTRIHEPGIRRDLLERRDAAGLIARLYASVPEAAMHRVHAAAPPPDGFKAGLDIIVWGIA